MGRAGRSPPMSPGVPEAFFNDVWSSSDGANWTRVTEHAAWSPRGMIQGGVEFNGRMWLLGGGTYDTPPGNRSGSSTTRFGVLRTASIGEKTRSRRGRRASTTASPCSTTRCGCSPAGTPTRRASIAKDVWYSSDGVTWTEVHTPWQPRHAGSAMVYDNHLWMVAGSNPDSNPIGDVWRFGHCSLAGDRNTTPTTGRPSR